MNAGPEVSVVMANYNGRSFLSAAIRSLQAQTLKDWELLFVDDGSNDDSLDRARSFAGSDERIRLIDQQHNAGPAAARNKAIRLARGRWIAIFDSDDLMHPERLERLRRRSEADDAAIVADNLALFSDGARSIRPFLPRHLTRAPRWIDLPEYITSNCLYSRIPDLGYLKPLIRTQCLSSRFFYDERLRIGEDYELMTRLLASGLKLRLEPAALYYYRKHPGSFSHRMGADSIAPLVEANERLANSLASVEPELASALERRRRTLASLLRYDRVIGHLKRRQFRAAIAKSVMAPSIWPLLTQPIGARLARLRQQTRSAEPAAALGE